MAERVFKMSLNWKNLKKYNFFAMQIHELSSETFVSDTISLTQSLGIAKNSDRNFSDFSISGHNKKFQNQ